MLSRAASMAATVVLTPGPDVRVLGLSVRERNRRVAVREGAVVAESGLAESGDRAVGSSGDLRHPENHQVPDGQMARWPDRQMTKVVIVPPTVLIERVLFAALPTGRTDLARELATPDSPLAQDDCVMDVSTPRKRRRAGWLILQRTGKASDGWVSRHWNRPISRAVSYVLLSAGLTASHASFMTLLVGLGAAVLAATPGYIPLVLNGVLFQLASVLDGVDGEMARSTLTESEAGARLDDIVDKATYLACFVGIIVGWTREGAGVQAIGWTVGVLVALVLSILRAKGFVTRHSPDASFVFVDRAVRRAARDSGRPSLRMAAAGFTLLRRDLFSLIYLGAMLTGQRAIMPALVAGGVLLANVTFSTFRRELAQAAVAVAEGHA